jgi:hypothetical protein
MTHPCYLGIHRFIVYIICSKRLLTLASYTDSSALLHPSRPADIPKANEGETEGPPGLPGVSMTSGCAQRKCWLYESHCWHALSPILLSASQPPPVQPTQPSHLPIAYHWHPNVHIPQPENTFIFQEQKLIWVALNPLCCSNVR